MLLFDPRPRVRVAAHSASRFSAPRLAVEVLPDAILEIDAHALALLALKGAQRATRRFPCGQPAAGIGTSFGALEQRTGKAFVLAFLRYRVEGRRFAGENRRPFTSPLLGGGRRSDARLMPCRHICLSAGPVERDHYGPRLFFAPVP